MPTPFVSADEILHIAQGILHDCGKLRNEDDKTIHTQLQAILNLEKSQEIKIQRLYVALAQYMATVQNADPTPRPKVYTKFRTEFFERFTLTMAQNFPALLAECLTANELPLMLRMRNNTVMKIGELRQYREDKLQLLPAAHETRDAYVWECYFEEPPLWHFLLAALGNNAEHVKSLVDSAKTTLSKSQLVCTSSVKLYYLDSTREQILYKSEENINALSLALMTITDTQALVDNLKTLRKGGIVPTLVSREDPSAYLSRSCGPLDALVLVCARQDAKTILPIFMIPLKPKDGESIEGRESINHCLAAVPVAAIRFNKLAGLADFCELLIAKHEFTKSSLRDQVQGSVQSAFITPDHALLQELTAKLTPPKDDSFVLL